jgi:hypothetical protein
MSTQHTQWPAIDVAELRYGLAFGSSVEEIAEFLQRDVDDVRHQMEVEAHKTAQVSLIAAARHLVGALRQKAERGHGPSRRK